MTIHRDLLAHFLTHYTRPLTRQLPSDLSFDFPSHYSSQDRYLFAREAFARSAIPHRFTPQATPSVTMAMDLLIQQLAPDYTSRFSLTISNPREPWIAAYFQDPHEWECYQEHLPSLEAASPFRLDFSFSAFRPMVRAISIDGSERVLVDFTAYDPA